MKINRTGQVNLNPYKQQQYKQASAEKRENKADELQISKEALKLQEKNKLNETRQAYVERLKHQVDTGQYKVDAERTAQKMMDFWTDK